MSSFALHLKVAAHQFRAIAIDVKWPTRSSAYWGHTLLRHDILIGALVLVLPVIVLAQANDSMVEIDSNEKCQYDRSAMLELDFASFDQDFNGGWRQIAEDSDCTLIAANLIRDYIDHHKSDEKLLHFHEGQMRAKGGQTARAIELIRSTKEPDGENNYFGWSYYVDATIAFLEKDKDALIDARDALAALPKPTNFSAIDRHGNPVELEWPPNIDIVNGFVECFSASYDVAYSTCSGLYSRDGTDSADR